MSRFHTQFTFGCAMALVACGDGTSGGDSGRSAASASCTPGQAVACPCSDGTTSSQTCADDGLSLGPCACGEAPGANGVAATANGGGGTAATEGPGTSGAPSGATSGGGAASTGGAGGSGTSGASGAPAGGAAGGTAAGGTPAGGTAAGGTAAGGTAAGGTAAGGTAAGGTAAGGAPTGGSGCGSPAPADSGSVAVAGVAAERTYILDVPTTYDPDRPYPLVFGFHGATSSASAFASAYYGNLDAPVGEDAIIVYPDALVVNGTTSWSHDTDIAFFDALVAKITAGYCIDESRIFATGHSSGGFFTNTLGCQRGNVLRAIAPLAGGGPAFCIDQSRTPGALCSSFWQSTPCVGSVAAWIEHGDADQTVDIQNGLDSRQFWAEQNGCDVTSETPVDPSPCVSLGGCDAGLPVHWCVNPGAGHEPQPSLTGPGAWAFFSSL